MFPIFPQKSMLSRLFTDLHKSHCKDTFSLPICDFTDCFLFTSVLDSALSKHFSFQAILVHFAWIPCRGQGGNSPKMAQVCSFWRTDLAHLDPRRNDKRLDWFSLALEGPTVCRKTRGSRGQQLKQSLLPRLVSSHLRFLGDQGSERVIPQLGRNPKSWRNKAEKTLKCTLRQWNIDKNHVDQHLLNVSKCN